jgi:hypothetical protein
VHNPQNHINQTFYYLKSISAFGAVILLIIALLGCTIRTKSNLKEPNPVIFQKWLHSYEEDTKELKVYRPSSFDFPRGWGRSGMKFEESGTFMLFDIAPNDAIVQIPGKWHQISKGKLAISFPSEEKEDYTIEINEINSEILKVKK